MNQSNKLIFIVGPGRSGTSLLQSMLDSNSKIKFIKENQFLRKVLFGRNNISWFLKNRKDRVNNIDDLIKNQKINKKDFYYKIINNEYDKNLIYIGDKDPNLIDYLNKLIFNFPKSKIILMIRDPRDIILSRLKANWSSKLPFIFQLLIVYSQLNKLNVFLKKNNNLNHSICKIKYENLLDSPKVTISSICRFLNLNFETEMLNYQKSSIRLVSDNEFQWKSKTLEKLDIKNYNKWMKEFNSDQKHFLNIVFKEFLHNNKYQYLTFNSLPFHIKLINNFKFKLIKLLSNFYFLRFI